MKRFILLAFLHGLACMVIAQVHVNGYFRSNGTYVQPHYRSSPDGNPYNNWSYPGNTNPYTGKVATGNPSTYLDNYYNRNNGSSNTVPSGGVRAWVTARRLNVLSSASSGASVVATLDEKAEVTILGRYSDPWYYVQFKYYDPEVRYTHTAYGYIHSAYLAGGPPSQEASSSDATYVAEPHTTSEGRQYYVTTASLDVHAAPNATSKVITQLTFKDLTTVVSRHYKPWYQVQVTYLKDGRMSSTTSAYVYADDLSTKSPDFVHRSTSEEPTPATKPETQVVVQSSNTHPFGEHYGKINFWSNVPREDISVYIDHVYVGQLTTFFSEQPTLCGSQGTISVVRPAGTYLVQAIGQWFHFSSQVTVCADGCVNTRIGTP